MGSCVQTPSYRPIPSPSLSQDPSTRGALDAMQMGNARLQQLQQHQSGEPALNGDGSHEGLLHTNGSNGLLSRPNSSASNYLLPTPSAYPIDQKPSPGAPSPRPPPSDIYPSAGNTPHITLPPPLPPTAFQLNGTEAMTPGGSRPFAGHPQTPAPLEHVGTGEQPFGFPPSSEDIFADLSGLDFSFESFIDNDLFKDEALV